VPKVPAKDAKRSRSTLLFVLVGAAAFVAAAALIAVSLSGGSSSKSPSPSEPLTGVGDALSVFGGIPQHGITVGNPKAPVTIVEYADLQCPYCAHFATDELPGVVQEDVRTGKAKIEYRGLAFIGPDSLNGLRTAFAAGEQGKLWQFVDILFANQGAENSGWLSDSLLRRVGEAVPGLDVDKMFADRGGARVTALVQSASASAQTAGVNSTPTLFVGPTGGTLTQVSSATASAVEQAVAAAS